MASDEGSVRTEAAVEFLGTGRRKAAVAQVRLRVGEGKFLINGRALEHYLCLESARREALSPLQCVALADKFDVTATVLGGGIHGQAGALRLGIARALQKIDTALRPPLKKAGHLTRDGRMKERKKSGQPGARKRFQFSKR
ncbi:MAG: 30S ribosomal protein S9 [Puniceicoccales bacterium]|jgi:small subunit ribosomal protein S9|nr:30S ribosomal protein S9 [Puniceicoccales bacterium]